MKNRKFLLFACGLFALTLQFSCLTPSNTSAGYYQGTFTSNNSAHPSGTAKVNITENGDFVNMTLEAVDFMVVHVDHVNVDRDNEFPYTLHFKLNTSEQITGTMDIWGGNISIGYSNPQNTVFTIHASK